MRGVLAVRDARVFLLGWTLSQFGDWAMFYALALPGLFAPVAGLIVDRLPRRHRGEPPDLLWSAAKSRAFEEVGRPVVAPVGGGDWREVVGPLGGRRAYERVREMGDTLLARSSFRHYSDELLGTSRRQPTSKP